MIISTGIALLSDIEKAIAACRRAGNDQIVILKCTSAYPAPIDELNLRTIADIRERFGVEVGISDHTMTQTACVAAIALGARVVERHIILSKEIESLDSTFSTDAQEFAALVSAIREAEIALGDISYELTPEAVLNRRFGRSLFVVSDVNVGDEVTLENVRSIRPADGLPPEQFPDVLGRHFRLDARAGTPLTLDLLQ
jgi:pseudaminic acid synthase